MQEFNPREDIKSRTFGVEIEMCNVERQAVSLPSGYSWSKDEEIVNTDGSSNKQYGGEVNTPPLNVTKLSDLRGLKSVYESMTKAGGVTKWTTDTHVHIYVGDLSLEQIKKVFLFFYVCYPYFKKYTKLSEWDEKIFNCQPIPEEKYFEGLLQAETFSDMEKLFTNQSKKGFIRHAVNISAYFKTKTIEFRAYHGTNDFYMAMNCVYSTYRMFYYAITHELEDFKALKSYEDFVQKTKLKYDCPPELCPLLYQGNPYSGIETFQTKSLPYNSKQATALYDAIKAHGHKELCIVNGFMYYYELFFNSKLKLSIYSQDPFCHLLYILANGKMTIKYKEKLSWLEEYNKPTSEVQLALALFVTKLQRFTQSSFETNKEILESLKRKANKSIEKIIERSKGLLKMLTECEYHVGTLQDAISDKKVIFFNYGKDKRQKRAYKLIKENSDLEMEFDLKRNDYYEIIETLPKESYFYYFSNSPYLRNMHKLAMFNSSTGSRYSAGRFLYCNKDSEDKKASTSYSSYCVEIDEIVPPDDLIIDDPRELRIIKVSGRYLSALQKKYVKKVDVTTSCLFPFVVMYGKYTLGGFGFELPRHKGFDLWQLTDFCTNNNVPRLSKLILLCIQSALVQKTLSRTLHRLVVNVVTLAYTHKPVSMKYRGCYDKVKELSSNGCLAYEGKLGKYATIDEIIDKYKKMRK